MGASFWLVRRAAIAGVSCGGGGIGGLLESSTVIALYVPLGILRRVIALLWIIARRRVVRRWRIVCRRRVVGLWHSKAKGDARSPSPTAPTAAVPAPPSVPATATPTTPVPTSAT